MQANAGRTGAAKRLKVAGSMSGTSLDGVDVAVIDTDGREIFGFGDSYFRPYTPNEQALLRSALGQWEAAPEVLELIENAHAEAFSQVSDYDLIGFHGQTLNHAPHEGRTYQAGNGAALARRMGRPVVWDFRSEDVAQGGQGAPLAPFYHHALARHIGAKTPIAFLNLGGVGNLTWVNPQIIDPAHPDALLAFDTGPANAPVNDLVATRLGQAYDKGGILAAKGVVQRDIVAQGLAHPYFERSPPKSLDRNEFHDILRAVSALSVEDAAATLTAFCAACIDRALEHCLHLPEALYVTGGGRHNATLMAMISAGTDVPVQSVEQIGLDGDMLEAQAFGFLAARVQARLPISAPTTTGGMTAICGGRISFSSP